MLYQLNAAQRFSTDIVVVGDGLAAFSAALEAVARRKSVLLAVAGPSAAAELTIAMCGEVDESGDEHLQALVQRVAAVGGQHDGWLDPAITQMVADQMLREAGVQVLLYAVPVRAVADGSRVVGVLMAGKDGCYTLGAGAVVDATEGGVLFRNAGARFTAPAKVRASRTLYFEMAGDDLAGLPGEVAGFSLQARVTWPGEVCVTITKEAPWDGEPVPAALQQESRLAEREIAAACREAVDGLQGAMLTHSGHRLLPLEGACLADAHQQLPRLLNLVGAGCWVEGVPWGSLAAMSACGRSAGATACLVAPPAPDDCTVTEALDLPAEGVAVGVFGGGTGGAVAAWAAARNGAQTAVYEAGWSLGGIPTNGGIHWYYHGVPGGLQQLLHDEAEAVTADLGGAGRTHGFHPEARKIALLRLLGESGVAVNFGWTACDAIREGDRLTGVLLAAPGCLRLVTPAVAVDGTGDGDVAAAAGAEVLYGRSADGLSHQYSQSAALLRDGNLAMYNFDAGYVDARDVADLTRARREALQLYWNPETFTPTGRPFNISYLLGLRQSRHIVGDYVLTLDDQATNRHFDDVVAYGHCHQDNHAFDYENENEEGMFWCWGLGFWKQMMRHEVPYRCLTARGLANVLVACRAVSVNREAHMLFRMIRDMYRIGEAAGTAAALAAAGNGDTRAVSLSALQGKLSETGALLADWPQPEQVAEPEALVARLVDELPRLEVWHLYQQGERAVPALLAGLASGNESTAWWCALALAMVGRQEAVPVLLQALEQRDARLPKTDPNEPDYYVARMAPRWLAAVMMLGRLQERSAVPAIAMVLQEPAPGPDPLLAALRALGRIGDAAAVPAIQQFVRRDDLPTAGEFQDSIRQGMKVAKDVTWQLRLAAADALARLGAPDEALVRPYLQDPRAYVRAYAGRLAEG